MKQVFFILVFFCCVSSVNAQSQQSPLRLYNKGMNTIGLTFSGGFGGYYGFVGDTYLNYGRFWANRFTAGVDLGLQAGANNYTAYLGGPYARYYLLTGKFNPLVEASYQGGYYQSSDGENREGFIQQLGAGGGISYNGIFDRFGIELVTLYSTTIIKGDANDGFTTSLRLKYFFGEPLY